MRRTAIATFIAAAIAASAIATTPALARPLDLGYGGRADPGARAQAQQHLYYHELGQQAEPTEPAHAVSMPLPRHASGGDDTAWIVGLAAGAVVAALGAAGLSRHARIRARRVAV